MLPRRLALFLVLTAVVAAAFGIRPLLADDQPTPLEAQTRAAIEAILNEPTLPSAIWGIDVFDLTTGRSIYRTNSDKNLIPASNLKLFTTATALEVLGPDYRYLTRLYFDGETLPDGTIRGTLTIRGSGDPTFGSRNDEDAEDPLVTWAEALRTAGVTAIEGQIIGDDDVFDDHPWAEGWDVWHVATEDYAPGAGGLAYRDNLVELQMNGSRVTTSPEGYVQIRNGVQSSRGGGARPFRIDRELGTNTITLSGRISSRYRGTLHLPIHNATRFTLHAFAEALRDAGIRLDADMADVDDLTDKPDYEGKEPLFVHASPPMHEIVRDINRRSDNFYAEQVFRTFAANGSTRDGARRVLGFLDAAGADTEGLSIRDGSGLSRKDLITPHSMVVLLDHMSRHPARDAFFDSLPEGGGSGSTLRNRMRGLPVRAKTGSLAYVRALSGYITAPNGHQYAFCVIANNYTTSGGSIASAQDRIVRALATGQRVPEE
ncbi:MAG: D-alanyl-D-alanine carboxypeptidase/D-alanyl-D-alanine-endopeptidase [Rhodothermaceae bacterium]|nr:D-alanyl-D-alanine carboxypeptidase/D-alanyl-D-alanine-endopeptidase [Rhodothermaceae bacterium]